MRSLADYLALVPPLYANKPKFRATLTATLEPFADAQIFLDQLPQAFDLDTAIGVQLDVDGEWIGRSRIIPVAVTRPWFSWDTEHFGWNEGYWKQPAFAGDTLASLDDETYRRLLRAKIVANFSDGTVADAQTALATYFVAPTLIFVSDRTPSVTGQRLFSWDLSLHGWDEAVWKSPLNAADHLWMNWTIGVSGAFPNKVDLAILAQSLIPVVPAGVAVETYVITVDQTALFGWDVDNEFVSGWDVGSWGASPDWVAQNIVVE